MKKHRLVLYLPEDIGEEIERRAELTNLSVSSYLGLIVMQGLNDRHSC
jgi:hypothetical protein